MAASAEEPGRDPAKLSKFESEVVAVFVDMLQTLGLPKSYGEIYGLLYATAEPLGFAEIHDRLELSKGSISGGIKALKELGAIRAVGNTTDRRELFEPEVELRKLLLAFLAERLEPQLKANMARMAQLDSLLKTSPLQSGQRNALQARLSKLTKWRQKAAGLLPWIKKFLG
ncbi:transcriptional regulator [Synoicihabitans lomoniglobus]|uniref:HTH-type transcriptional regulator n=1 Tax=Synoicihabitans lomoniglobus TaxID=2909285 RepID=A0AAF0CQR0_9BACT|nr:transcriptional regulator [Opitutaceae bacterium LMO-M01]